MYNLLDKIIIFGGNLHGMDRLTLKKVMLGNQREVPLYKVIKRDIDLSGFDNYVLVGIRRAGKSFLLYQKIQQLLSAGMGWDEIVYLNFEDERLVGFEMQDFDSILEIHYEMYGKRPYLFLDEIHNIDGWEKFARRLADQKYSVYITGSNAKMLSSEIATTLGGRYLQIVVFPYSFVEYLNSLNVPIGENDIIVPEDKANLLRHYAEYFHSGGFPEAAPMREKRNYLISAYQKIYLGDIAGRNSITNIVGLRVMLKKIAESVKQPISLNRITSVASTAGGKVSVTTVAKYIDYAVDAWLLFRIRNITSKLSERESICKYYLIDNGLLNGLLTDAETSLHENLVAITLLRHYGINDDVFYYNDGNAEVDFYIPFEGIAIQACYSMVEQSTFEREIGGLTALSKVKELKRRIVLTFDSESQIINDRYGKIEIIPLWKFLLDN